jgi:hypothetical protein
MKTLFLTTLICFLIINLIPVSSEAQISPVASPSLANLNPWTVHQLMEPAELAAILKSPGSDKPLIFNIGAVEDIKGAKHIGPVNETANLETFKTAIQSLPKNTVVVIYCGCCPFTKCPNIRPAFFELKKLGFTNIKVLNLPTNLKTNWISKGYPLAGS